jgi:hypothetical protein
MMWTAAVVVDGDGDGGGGRDSSDGDDENNKITKQWIIGMEGEGMADDDLTSSGSVCGMSLGKLSLCISLFTRAVYRVFILWCEYPTRLLPFCAYKGNEKMGIRKVMT